MKPYYESAGITIYHGDCREVLPSLPFAPSSLLTDPPYGIDYESGAQRVEGSPRSIVGDGDTSLRDSIVATFAAGINRPALVFGSWKRAKPAGTRGVLIWDKGGALGMGDLRLPWKFDHEEIYVLGYDFTGKRSSGSVLRCPPVQATGRRHPHEKPVELMQRLLSWLPGRVIDPFCGSGSTLRAAKNLGREAIGIEINEQYAEIAAERLSQEVLDFGSVHRASATPECP